MVYWPTAGDDRNMIVKYEAIAKDCDRIEAKTDDIHGQMHDVNEIKGIVAGIRTQCEQNQQAISGMLDLLKASRADLEQLLVSTSEGHSQQAEKLNSIMQRLTSFNEDMKDGMVEIGLKVDASRDKAELARLGTEDIRNKTEEIRNKTEEIRNKIVPVAKFAKLISTPLNLILFLFALIAAALLVYETATKVWEVFFHRTPQVEAVQERTTPTNRGPGQQP